MWQQLLDLGACLRAPLGFFRQAHPTEEVPCNPSGGRQEVPGSPKKESLGRIQIQAMI